MLLIRVGKGGGPLDPEERVKASTAPQAPLLLRNVPLECRSSVNMGSRRNIW